MFPLTHQSSLLICCHFISSSSKIYKASDLGCLIPISVEPGWAEGKGQRAEGRRQRAGAHLPPKASSSADSDTLIRELSRSLYSLPEIRPTRRLSISLFVHKDVLSNASLKPKCTPPPTRSQSISTEALSRKKKDESREGQKETRLIWLLINPYKLWSGPYCLF